MKIQIWFLLALFIILNSCNQAKNTIYKLCTPCFISHSDVLYFDVFGHIHGSEVFYDYDQAICCAKYNHKPVVVIFSGWTTINFEIMYEKVLKEKRIQGILKDNFIVVYLYVDDKTILPKKEWFNSPYNKNIAKQLGQKNSVILIDKFKTGAEPYLVILDENEYQVNKGLSFTTDEKKVYDWLAEGLSNAGASVPKIHFNTVLVCNEND